jgi:hypothetical protein
MVLPSVDTSQLVINTVTTHRRELADAVGLEQREGSE